MMNGNQRKQLYPVWTSHHVPDMFHKKSVRIPLRNKSKLYTLLRSTVSDNDVPCSLCSGNLAAKLMHCASIIYILVVSTPILSQLITKALHSYKYSIIYGSDQSSTHRTKQGPDRSMSLCCMEQTRKNLSYYLA